MQKIIHGKVIKMIKKREIKQTYTEEQIRLLGKIGNRWQKHGKDRIYFDVDDVLSWLGYRWRYYNTGNVSGATYDGKKVSNYSFNNTRSSIEKVWYDVTEKGYIFYLDVVSSYTPRSSNIIEAIEEAAGIEEQKPTLDPIDKRAELLVSKRTTI
jgi:hypothetical protein